jgi:hypothetical protein
MAKPTTRVAQAMGWPRGYPISGFGVARRPPNGLGWAAQPPHIQIWGGLPDPGDSLATPWPRVAYVATLWPRAAIQVAVCHPKRLSDLSPSLSPLGWRHPTWLMECDMKQWHWCTAKVNGDSNVCKKNNGKC